MLLCQMPGGKLEPIIRHSIWTIACEKGQRQPAQAPLCEKSEWQPALALLSEALSETTGAKLERTIPRCCVLIRVFAKR